MKNVDRTSGANNRRLFITVVILTIFIIVGGYFFYTGQVNFLRKQKEGELKTIAEFKIRHISSWYQSEVDDAYTISTGAVLKRKIQNYIESKTTGNKNALIEELNEKKLEHDYFDLHLVTPTGEVIASTDKRITGIDPAEIKTLGHVSLSNEIVSSRLFRSVENGKIFIDFISPIINESNEVTSVLIFKIDPEAFLFPIVKRWPTQSKFSEAYLFRIEQDSIVFLNQLRHKRNTALQFRLPISKMNSPAVKGATGYVGLVESEDYTGSEVLAYVSGIPSTPWFLVAKMDKAEIHFELTSLPWLIIGIVILLIIGTIFAVSWHYNYRQRIIYKELLDKEKELWQHEAKYKTTMDSLGEGVIVIDVNGKLQYMNKLAQELTEWNIREARGRHIEEIYPVKNELTGKKENNILKKVLKYGVVKELANHTVLISKNGKEIPVLDTGAPIYDRNNTIIGIAIAFIDETEKRKSNRKIAESEKRLHSTLDNMLEGCQIIDTDLRYVYVNHMAASHGKTTKKKLMGKRMTEVYPGIEKTEMFKILSSCLVDKVPGAMENKFEYADGSVGYFKLRFEPVPEGIFILSEDITKRKLAEEKVKESQKFLSTLFSTIGDVIVVQSFPDRKIRLVNDAVKKMFGYTPEEVVGKDVRFVYPSEQEYNDFGEKVALAISEHIPSVESELRLVRKDGDEIICDIQTTFLKENGVVTLIITVLRDITEKKKMVRDLIEAKEKAEEMNKIKSHFFATMSHELRTPFVGIMGYADLLAENLPDSDEKEMARGILRTSIRMKDTITKILNLSNAEFSGVEVTKRKIDIKYLLNMVYEQFVKAAEQKNLEFKTEFNVNSLAVETDEALFLEILNNLVSNAIIYTNEGTVGISAEEQIKNGKKYLRVKVYDTGVGIPKEKQKVVWEEFRQASEGLTRSYQGTGLGLSIVKKYSELLGANIYLESEEGKGTTFTFELPV